MASTTRSAAFKAHSGQLNQHLRPIVTSLNGDNSWLLSFPRPSSERENTGKAYFHVVQDPWLNGRSEMWPGWIGNISLSSPPCVTSGAGVEGIVRDIESAVADAATVQGRLDDGEVSPIDAIIIHLHYGDHMHKPTLLTFSSRIPVFATSHAARIMTGWKHFETIIPTKELDPYNFDGNWTSLHPGAPLPDWLTQFHILGHHELNFASALIWTSAQGRNEAILHSPHGLHTSQPSLQALLHKSSPGFNVLLLLHGLKESWTLNWQTTFGVANGLELQRETDAKYWVNTHNDRLKYGGVIWFLANDIFRTLEWGLGLEKAKAASERKEVEVINVENGDCIVLG